MLTTRPAFICGAGVESGRSRRACRPPARTASRIGPVRMNAHAVIASSPRSPRPESPCARAMDVVGNLEGSAAAVNVLSGVSHSAPSPVEPPHLRRVLSSSSRTPPSYQSPRVTSRPRWPHLTVVIYAALNRLSIDSPQSFSAHEKTPGNGPGAGWSRGQSISGHRRGQGRIGPAGGCGHRPRSACCRARPGRPRRAAARGSSTRGGARGP